MGHVNSAAWFVPQQLVQVGAVVHAGKLLVGWWKAPVWVVGGAADYPVVAANVGDVDGSDSGMSLGAKGRKAGRSR